MPERTRPPQRQARQPGREQEMTLRPETERQEHRGSGKLRGQVLHPNGGEIING